MSKLYSLQYCFLSVPLGLSGHNGLMATRYTVIPMGRGLQNILGTLQSDAFGPWIVKKNDKFKLVIHYNSSKLKIKRVFWQG